MKSFTLDNKTAMAIGVIVSIITVIILYLQFKEQREKNKEQSELVNMQKELTKLQIQKTANGGK